MSTMWAAPGREQVFDAVTSRPVPQQPVPFFGVQPTLYPPFAMPQTPYPLFGVPPFPYPTFGVPTTPYSTFGMPTTPWGMGAQSLISPFTSMYGVHQNPYSLFGAPQIAPMLGIPPTGLPTLGPLASPVSPLAHPLAQAMLNLQPLTSTFGVQPTTIPPIGPLAALTGMQEPLLAAMLGSAPYSIPGALPSVLPFPTPGLHPAFASLLGMQHLQAPGMLHQHMALSAPISFILAQISLKEAASRLSDNTIKERIISGVNEAIHRYVEDLAGVTLHPWLKTVPGAAPWVYPLVSELVLISHRYPEASLRNEILNVAGQILQKSIAPTTGEGEAGRHR